ncbi:cysteine-rich small domain-containing protein [Clostridia bacterium]|nr:cysteine-rich small domain-containing protein [Clostridia bacterium]
MEHYKFVQNRNCEYFPCHKGVPEEDFNCLFCFCPLYMLGEDCGGNFYYNKKDIKDCSNCTKPHNKESYEYVMSKMGLVIDSAKKK